VKVRCLKLLDATIISVSAPDIDLEIIKETDSEIVIKINKKGMNWVDSLLSKDTTASLD
jgi:hypothetical protein